MTIYEYYKNMEESFKENFKELYDVYVDEIKEERNDKDIINNIIKEWYEDSSDDAIDIDIYPCRDCEEKESKCEEGDWCDRFQIFLDEYEKLRLTYIYNLQKYYNILTIKDIRTRFNLTQKALSELTGIPKRTIENWEGNKSEATPYIIKLVAFYVENNSK